MSVTTSPTDRATAGRSGAVGASRSTEAAPASYVILIVLAIMYIGADADARLDRR